MCGAPHRSPVRISLPRLPDPLADPEDVPVGVANMHLADVPGLVGRRVGHLDALSQAMPVNRVDVVHPDRHPDALVARLAMALCRRERALPPAALRALAQEDLALAGADGPERRRAAPLEALLPAELLKPGEALDDVRDVQD